MDFRIENMTNEEIDLVNIQSRLASPRFREATLIFGGTRHQSAAFYGVQPKIGEKCHIERRWGRGSDRHEERFAGEKGAVHLVNEAGLSYGTLLSGERKLKELKLLGVENITIPDDVRSDNSYFLKEYVITEIDKTLDTIHFVSVKGVI